MGCIAVVRCVLVLRCGSAGVVWCDILMQAEASASACNGNYGATVCSLALRSILTS